MSSEFLRTGELMDLRSYPQWVQDVVQDCDAAKRDVREHELFLRMRDGDLSRAVAQSFIIGVWPVIEQFPQYMAMTLLKIRLGQARGHELARRYLIRNMRVEQNHAEYWVLWAKAHGLERGDLLAAVCPAAAEALSHWCWHSCERDCLQQAMAATNYAIEGVTGEWACLVCSKDTYELGFPEQVRKTAMRWLKVHAAYDDKHPWEALEIIATVVGQEADVREVEGIRSRIRRSYQYMRLTLDECLAAGEAQRSQASRGHGRLCLPQA